MNKLFSIKEIEIDAIIIIDRARKQIGDLTELKKSIMQSGLLQPILVNDKLRLIAGERRIKACKELGITHIAARIMPDLTVDDIMIIELAENCARKDFMWHEIIDIKYRLHLNWKKQAKVSWSYADTAKKFSCARSGLSTDLALAEALITFPELKQYDTKGKAREAYKKLGERAEAIIIMDSLSDEERKRLTLLSSGQLSKENKSKKALNKFLVAKHEDISPLANSTNEGSHDDIPLEPPPNIRKAPECIYMVDTFENFHVNIPENVVGFCELDMPYAIDFDKVYGKTSKIEAKAIDWTLERLMRFCQDMFPIIYNKMMDNSWFLCWTSKEHWLIINSFAFEAGFNTQEPGIWVKSGGSSNRPTKRMISNYEMFLLFRKGKASFNTSSMLSTIKFDPPAPSQRIHQWEKPLTLYQYFMHRLGRPGSIFLCPCAGSGNAMIAAALNDMIPMGCDEDNRYMEAFYQRLNNYFI